MPFAPISRPPPLMLSAEDLNALLQTDLDFEAMKGKLYVTAIHDGQVTAHISVPMEEAGLPMFKGRYSERDGNAQDFTHGTGSCALSRNRSGPKAGPCPRCIWSR